MIELKQQLPILTYPDGLKTFLSQQTERRARVKSIIDAAAVAVAKARDKAIQDPDIGETRRVGGAVVRMLAPADKQAIASIRTLAQKQVVRAVSDIRKGLDAEAIPIIKQMNGASDTAKEMAQRHWDKYSVVRRTKGTAGGLMEATQLRAYYSEILEDVEPRELAAWAQQAIDQGDPVLASVILSQNFRQPRDRRAFHNQALLDKLPNIEYDTAQAQLGTVTMLYEQATVQYATFGREYGNVSLQRMAYGLKYGDVKLAEDGSINPQGAE